MKRLRQLLSHWRRREDRAEREDDANVKPLPIMHDPLKAIKTQLVIAAYRLRDDELRQAGASLNRRRWRSQALRRARRGVLAISMFVLLAVGAVTGAAAVGVDVSDGLLSALLADNNKPREIEAPAALRVPHDHALVKPGPGQASEPVVVAWRGTPAVYAQAFINRANQVCLTSASSPPLSLPTRGSVGCVSTRYIKAELIDGATVVGINSGERYTSVVGIAAADAIALDVVGPEGPLKARLSGLWIPPVADPLGIRLFVAVGPTRPNRAVAAEDRIVNPRLYGLRLRLPGGEIRTLGRLNERP